MRADPRDSYRWKTLRRRLVRSAEVCAICGRLLDRTAPARSRWSPSVDHIVPLHLGGAPFDPSNLRVTHFGCNSSRGVGRRPARAVTVARRAQWW
jgi:5-methylcytosine-specific restriction endonuclease McrA